MFVPRCSRSPSSSVASPSSATITPAAGYVSPSMAVVIGIISGVVCYAAVALKNKLEWDDALDVWGVHGVGGFIGVVLLGILFLLGHVSVQTTERYLGTKQDLVHAPNDGIKLSVAV